MIEGSAIALLEIIRGWGKEGFSGREGRSRDVCTKAKIEAVLKSRVKTKNLGVSSPGMMIGKIQGLRRHTICVPAQIRTLLIDPILAHKLVRIQLEPYQYDDRASLVYIERL
ncbi:hypothetical protein QUB30_14675 [Microcoleus sp. BROC3]